MDRLELFRHLSAASIEKYVVRLAKVERANQEVRRQLDARCYDTEACRDIPACPTIVEGVRRRGVKAKEWHPPYAITLVIRPSDGGDIALYDEEEKAVLQAPDTELQLPRSDRRHSLYALTVDLDGDRMTSPRKTGPF